MLRGESELRETVPPVLQKQSMAIVALDPRSPQAFREQSDQDYRPWCELPELAAMADLRRAIFLSPFWTILGLPVSLPQNDA